MLVDWPATVSISFGSVRIRSQQAFQSHNCVHPQRIGGAQASSSRLRHAFGTPRQVLQAMTLAEVRPLVSLDDLPQVTAIAFLNSLRGWVDADWKN